MSADHIADHNCYRRGCRRDECRTADRNYRKHADLRRLRGIPGHIPGSTVAAHLRTLVESGHHIRGIAAESGVSERAIGYILHGQRNVTRPKALALLAIQPLDEAPRIDPTGTIRRIQALAAIGWPIASTAEKAGYTPSYLFNIIAGRIPTVPRDVAHRFATIYRQYSSHPGTSEFARSSARRNGWHGPLAWDDIDNPAAQPEIYAEHVLNFHERAKLRREEIEHLASYGYEPEQILDRLNGEVSISTVRQIVQDWRTGQKRDRRISKPEPAAA
ncbi:hypothetical protein OG864_45075 [Streptomyces sp. NBC_00124]|uniref:hypothetical protein n=1 Tax=Streptomyces sp. NBC_00124 TaxID=2975662 RepID=UPI002255D1C9|nr:hypothetical protein [Streptomyces sp. NBC_00124]MCX5365875.1 hypothetical protein [Streptomyces sp. NBC_00124]